MNVSIRDYEEYLYDHYKAHGIDTSLFMKLVEEVGEVAEVLNKRDGRKASDHENLNDQLANELVDVIHYAFAIASLNAEGTTTIKDAEIVNVSYPGFFNDLKGLTNR